MLIYHKIPSKFLCVAWLVFVIACTSTRLALSVDMSSENESKLPKDKLHVYLLIGGANMAGTANFYREEIGPISGCYLLNGSDEWEVAEVPLNRYSSVIKRLDTQRLGPGGAFAKTMVAYDATVAIGMVVNARDTSIVTPGGIVGRASRKRTSIKEWKKGSPCYDEAVRRTKIAQKTGTLKGILWHHGAADAKDAQYIDKLSKLISDLRADLGDANLPFVAGQFRSEQLINDQIATLPKKVPFTGFVSAEGLTGRGARAFSTDSMKIFGQRYARAVLTLQGKDPDALSATNNVAELPSLAVPVPTYEGTKESLHLYLLIGQSNMAGRAPFSVEDGKIMDGCWLFNRNCKWEPAKLPLNRYATIANRFDTCGLNPGYAFTQVMRKNNPEISIGLISNARGGTFINNWQQGSKYYKESVRLVKEAQKTGTLKGILWHQGESDFKSTTYLEKLKALIKAYREDLNAPELPFVVGQIAYFRGKGKLINDQLDQLPGQVPYTGVASSKNATGHLHFDTAGMKLIGRRYGEVMLQIQEK